MGLEVYGGLTYPFVSVIPDENGSLWNIYPFPTPAYPDAPTTIKFGTVDGINYLGTKLSVGQRVMFNSNDAILVTQADVYYYLLDENKGAAFIEKPEDPPPP
jgi:hypothetical protein